MALRLAYTLSAGTPGSAGRHAVAGRGPAAGAEPGGRNRRVRRRGRGAPVDPAGAGAGPGGGDRDGAARDGWTNGPDARRSRGDLSLGRAARTGRTFADDLHGATRRPAFGSQCRRCRCGACHRGRRLSFVYPAHRQAAGTDARRLCETDRRRAGLGTGRRRRHRRHPGPGGDAGRTYCWTISRWRRTNRARASAATLLDFAEAEATQPRMARNPALYQRADDGEYRALSAGSAMSRPRV